MITMRCIEFNTSSGISCTYRYYSTRRERHIQREINAFVFLAHKICISPAPLWRGGGGSIVTYYYYTKQPSYELYIIIIMRFNFVVELLYSRLQMEFAASKWKVHAGQPVRPPIGLSTLTLPVRECNPPPPKRPALAQNCRPGAPSRGHGETSSTTAARLLLDASRSG